MKKKAAILFSGMIRESEDHHKFFKENIMYLNEDKYDFDIYMCFWDYSDSYKSDGHYPISDEKKNNILEIFQPKEYKVLSLKQQIKKYVEKNQANFEFFERTLRLNHGGMKYKLNTIVLNNYCLKETFKLVESNNIKYDVVIKTRFDALFNTYNFIPDVEENEILITNRDSNQLFNDHVIVGSQKSMGVFYNSFDNLFDQNFMNTNNIRCIETLYRTILKYNNIKINQLYWNPSLKRNQNEQGGWLRLWNPLYFDEKHKFFESITNPEFRKEYTFHAARVVGNKIDKDTVNFMFDSDKEQFLKLFDKSFLTQRDFSAEMEEK